MFRKLIIISVFFLLSIIEVYSAPASSLTTKRQDILEPFSPEDRILILAPHPDDEAIACAGVIQQALLSGAKLKVVYLTNGDHNQVAFIVYEKRPILRKNQFIHMGRVRRQEAIKAMKLLGLKEEDLVFLGYPDFGTFAIFSQYWQTKRPYFSALTRISRVPYKDNLSFGLPYLGESILADLEKVLVKYKPNKIFVSHPADVNVDHKTFYLFLQVALADLRDVFPKPKVYPYLVHCLGWPLPRHYHPDLYLEPPKKFSASKIYWIKFGLPETQLEKKYRSILCYRSQTQSSAFYLLSFARGNELFGDYPEIYLKKQAPLSEQKLFELNEQISYGIDGDFLLIRIGKPLKLSKKSGLQVYLFGYSNSRPFAQMPKIRIITKYNKFRVFDKKRKLRAEDIKINIFARALIIKIPLELLGNPDFILAAIKGINKKYRIDSLGFHKIIIE